MAAILKLFNRWVIAGSFFFACVLIFLFSLAVLFISSDNPPGVPATAVVEIIFAAKTTEIETDMTADPTAFVEVTGGAPISSGEIASGVHVKITGTGGDGLRLRDEPGLGGDVIILGGETEVFIVNDGPEEADGYKWWFIKGRYDESRQGWAVADYLTMIENP